MRLRWPLLLWAVLGLMVCGAGRATATESLKASLGSHYSSGKYGTADTTAITYVPLTTRGEFGRWTVQATIPYLHISGPAGFIEGPNGPIQTTSGVSDGLGDILALGSYTLPPEKEWIPFVELIGLIKFPTASRTKGLGTGEFDFGIETVLSWTIWKWTPFATIGYRFLGSPPGTHLDNTILASLGGMYRLLDALNAGLLLNYRQAATITTGEGLEIVPFASWKVDTHWSLDVYTSAGLTTGSPAVGVGLQIGYKVSTLSSVTGHRQMP